MIWLEEDDGWRVLCKNVGLFFLIQNMNFLSSHVKIFYQKVCKKVTYPKNANSKCSYFNKILRFHVFIGL